MSTAWRTTFSESAGCAVSCSIADAVPPASVISCVTRSAPAKLMSLTITFAPLVASSLLIASPRPEPPPVTIATFPSKSDILSASLSRRC